MNFAIPLIVAILGVPQQADWPSADAITNAVAKAKESVAELYGDRLAKAKKPSEKIALGRELLRVANDSTDDPAAQFVLFYMARNLGVEAKDWTLTEEAITAIVDRFKANGPTNPAEQLERGDSLRSTATKNQLTVQLKAAEWYLRAKRNGKGLQRQIAEKRLLEVAEVVEGKRRSKADDSKTILGTWDVSATNGYHAKWTFSPDGTVVNGAHKGTWTIEATEIKIVWNKKMWETFHRPLNVNGTAGDSQAGQGIMTYKKISG